MAKNIKGINTADGTALIDYDALANKPNSDKNLTVDGGFADGKKTGDELKKKVNVNQGTSNNGKIMTVDNNGNIAPSETIQATKVVDSSGKNIQTKIQEIEDAPKLPLGGKTGNILSKKSMTDGDAEWIDVPPMLNAIYNENEERIVFSRSTPEDLVNNTLQPIEKCMGKSSYTLTSVAEAPVIIKEILGKTKQIITTGVQLFDMKKMFVQNDGGINIVISDDKISYKGINNSVVNIRSESFILHKGIFTFSINNVKTINGDNINIYINRKNNNQQLFFFGLSDTNTSKEINIETEVEVYIIINFSTIKERDTSYSIMLNTGNIPLPWEVYTDGHSSPSPDYPQEIKGVGNNGNVIIKTDAQNNECISSVSIPLAKPIYENDKICYVKQGENYTIKDGSVVKANKTLYGVHRQNETIVLDGSADEGWVAVKNSSGNYRNAIPASKIKIRPNGYVYCNRLIDMPGASLDVESISSGSDGSIIMYIPEYNTSNITLWRTYLSSNPLHIIYELNTPYFEPFEDQFIFYYLRTSDNYVHIYSDDILQPDLSVDVAKNQIGAYLLESYTQTCLNSIQRTKEL